ncbi:MAG: FHA domain-containing protein [Ruminococcaceae bacterium]|nr:FHA domain-containing protein [Oscillospiraceae bacterium]
MNEFLKQELIVELPGTQNTQYVFNDNYLFSLTEYKVLRSQNKNFAKCSKVLFNGKTKLLYFTSTYKSLNSMISTIDFDTFLSIITNVFSCMLEIKTNGFLSCTDLDLRFDKIFVDPNTLEVFLIYLPISTSDPDTLSYENEFRGEIIKLITAVPTFSTDKTLRVCTYLSNGTLSLEELYHNIRGEINAFIRDRKLQKTQDKGDETELQKGTIPKGTQKQPVLYFTAINTATPVRFTVNLPEFVIGKNAAKVHGVVTFNQAISRVHCKINYCNGEYTITDLGSANGTYVNKTRLFSNIAAALHNGDIVRLANSDFKVEF